MNPTGFAKTLSSRMVGSPHSNTFRIRKHRTIVLQTFTLAGDDKFPILVGMDHLWDPPSAVVSGHTVKRRASTEKKGRSTKRQKPRPRAVGFHISGGRRKSCRPRRGFGRIFLT